MMWTSYLLSGTLVLSLAEGACYKLQKDYYEEIGCKPEDTDEQGCVTSYDCSSLGQRRLDQCHYGGQLYDRGHKLERTPATACLAHCRCGSNRQPNNAKPIFSCIHVECPELFIGRPPSGCYRTYDHDKCCHVKQICEEQTSKNTLSAVCEYNGKTFQEGEKFYPTEEPCMKCICQRGFNGTFIEPFCRKVHCNLELVSARYISRGCVPVYYGEKGCCPIDWRCPEETTTVVVSKNQSDSSANVNGKTCEFGNLTMQVGDTLSNQSENVQCICRVPPHPVCIKQER